MFQLTSSAPTDQQDRHVDGPSISKRFKNLASSAECGIQRPSTLVEDEVSNYLHNDSIRLSEDADPLEYWNSCTAYPTLADFALDVLVIPCSSSASESLFSYAGLLCADTKNRVSPVNLENQVLLKANHKLLL